jgi:hypothetical protein
MAQWEYSYERLEQPIGLEGRDVTPEILGEMNRLGVDGWEVCSVLVYPQSWIVLLKREVPVMGTEGSRVPT